MLSCAAIQKLERYGQLGLKRNSTEDFVHSSLKDAKRANIYALTHAPTWQECLEALRQSSGNSSRAATEATAPTASGAPVTVTDALVYALSFTSSLVAHHLTKRQHQQQQQQMHEGGVADEGSARKGRKAATVATAAQDEDSNSAVFSNEEVAACAPATLVSLLKRVVVQIAREGNRTSKHTHGTDGEGGSGGQARIGGVRIADSKEFLQALLHLLSNTSVLLLYALSVELNATAQPSASSAGVVAEAQSIWRDGLVLLAASARLLRRASAAQQTRTKGSSGSHNSNISNDDSLFTVRSANALVKQFYAKHQQKTESAVATVAAVWGSSDEAVAELLQSHPILQVLLSYTNVMARSAVLGRPMAGGYAFLENFSPLQKLSLLHAALPDVSRLRDSLAKRSESESVSFAHNNNQNTESRFVESNTQQLLKDLLSTSICNRATRYVIYFRGDDLKLMQSKASQPSQYALHTFATTPPVEPTVASAFRSAMQPAHPKKATTATTNSSDATTLWAEQERCFYAVVFAQWVVSAPFFFEAFCSDSRWTAFAQEQRRMTLLRQVQERRTRREDRRNISNNKKAAGKRGGSATSATASETGSAAGDNDDTASTMSGATDNGRHSIAPSLETSRSMLSLESRASLLSTLSKQSAATYLSFLSVLKPAMGADGEGVEPTKFHESADGNTNLPLILLEELVLGLHRFMEAFPAEELDRLSLRALCWQSIGRLFLFIQDSISGDGSLALSGGGGSMPGDAKGSGKEGAPMTIFNLGTDLRYNHGLGYESLGLLFAKVIAPQFESGTQSPGVAAGAILGRAILEKEDAVATKRCVEAALSRCLSAYEEVAPQVVDMNLPVILRIAARTAAEADGSVGSTDVLYQFLAGIVLRLGKCNQVPVLLDALISSANADGTPSSTRGNDTAAGAGAGGEEDEKDDVAALQVVFSHPLCRAALIHASGLSMDPENLLGHLLKYVADWSFASGDSNHNDAENENEEGSGDKHKQDPQQVLFVLNLVATVLEGIQPTSMTSSAVLERSTELELLLSAFAQKHLYLSAEASATATMAATSSTLFRVSDLRGKARRQLWLHTLAAVYQSRAVTVACLRDLGLQNVKDYLALLNDSLWQVDRHVGALLLTGDEEEEENEGKEKPFTVSGGMGVEDLVGQMSATTHMTLPPHTHVQTLLPRLALQRLSLARAVSTVLGCPVSPMAEAKQQLAQKVLDAIQACCKDSTDDEEDTSRSAKARMTASLVFEFINDVSEEEWSSLAHYAKRKQLRATLVALLRRTFASAVHSGLQSPQQQQHQRQSLYVAPVWLSRCLRCAGGTALRAMTDMFLSYSSKDVVALLTPPVKGGHAADHSTASQELLAMLAALQYAYSIVGHVPFWPLLVDRASAWLSAIADTSFYSSSSSAETFTAALLVFLRCSLSYEARSGDVVRRTLLLSEGVVGSPASPNAKVEKSSPAAAATRKGLSRTFLEEVGVIATVQEEGGELSDGDGEHGEHATAYLEDELSAFGEELDTLVARMFCQDFAQVLLSLASNHTKTTTVTTPADAMSVLAFLYHTAVLATRVACREGRYNKPGVNAESHCTAVRFVHATAKTFEGCLTAATAAMEEGAGKGKRVKKQTAPLAVPPPHAALHHFLQALSRLPSGDTALTTGLPRRSNKKRAEEKGTKEEGEDVAAFANSTEDVWVSLLRFYIRSATNPGATEDVTDTQGPRMGVLRCMTTLYARLLASYSRTFIAPPAAAHVSGVKRAKRDDKNATAATAGKEKEIAGVKTVAAATSFAALLLQSHGASDLHSVLVRVFVPDSTASKGVVESVRVLSSLLLLLPSSTAASSQAAAADDDNKPPQHTCVGGLMAVWVLYNLFVESLAHDGAKKEGESAAVAGASMSAQAAALLASLLANLPLVVSADSTSLAAQRTQLEKAIVRDFPAKLALTLKQNGHLTEPAFLPSTETPSANSSFTRRTHFYQQALDSTVSALALLRADAAPPLLHTYILALLPQSLTVALCTDAAADDRYALLTSTALAVLRLTHIAPARVESQLKPHVLRLLSASTSAAFCRASRRHGARQVSSNDDNSSSSSSTAVERRSVYEILLAVLRRPRVLAALQDDVSIDVAWAFAALLLTLNNSSKSSSGESGVSATAQPQSQPGQHLAVSSSSSSPSLLSDFTLTQAEVMAVLSLLTQHWLPMEVVWRRSGQLPPLVNALFACVLMGVRDGHFERRVLNQVSNLFHQLVRLGINAAEEGEDDVRNKTANSDSDDDSEEENEEVAEAVTREDGKAAKTEEGSASPAARRARQENVSDSAKGTAKSAPQRQKPNKSKRTSSSASAAAVVVASYKTRVLCLAAIVADMFQLSRRFIAVFTTYSNDLDYIARDFLRALSRQHLPRTRGAPIAFHAGVRIRPERPSPATFADLVYTCVGDEECKALLRQAAMRLDEEEVEQGGGGSSEGLVERRHIFNVSM